MLRLLQIIPTKIVGSVSLKPTQVVVAAACEAIPSVPTRGKEYRALDAKFLLYKTQLNDTFAKWQKEFAANPSSPEILIGYRDFLSKLKIQFTKEKNILLAKKNPHPKRGEKYNPNIESTRDFKEVKKNLELVESELNQVQARIQQQTPSATTTREISRVLRSDRSATVQAATNGAVTNSSTGSDRGSSSSETLTVYAIIVFFEALAGVVGGYLFISMLLYLIGRLYADEPQNAAQQNPNADVDMARVHNGGSIAANVPPARLQRPVVIHFLGDAPSDLHLQSPPSSSTSTELAGTVSHATKEAKELSSEDKQSDQQFAQSQSMPSTLRRNSIYHPSSEISPDAPPGGASFPKNDSAPDVSLSHLSVAP